MGRGTSLLDAFAAANNVLLGAVQGIAELITRPGLINVDFADVKTVMSEMGNAMMGTGVARGEDRAEEAAEAAVASPLLEDIDLAGARGVLVNITAGMDMSIEEFETVGNHVKAYASDNATVVVGAVIDPEMSDELRVTVVATGIGAEKRPDIQLVSKPAPRPEPVVVEPKVEAYVEEAVHVNYAAPKATYCQRHHSQLHSLHHRQSMSWIILIFQHFCVSKPTSDSV